MPGITQLDLLIVAGGLGGIISSPPPPPPLSSPGGVGNDGGSGGGGEDIQARSIWAGVRRLKMLPSPKLAAGAASLFGAWEIAAAGAVCGEVHDGGEAVRGLRLARRFAAERPASGMKSTI